MPTTGLLAAESGFGLQVAAYKTELSAKKEIDKWRKAGHTTFYRHENVKKIGRWYRVYLGPFDSSASAKKQALKLREKGVLTNYFIRSLKTVPPLKPKPAQQFDAGLKLLPSAWPIPPAAVKKAPPALKRKKRKILKPTSDADVTAAPVAPIIQKKSQVPDKLVRVTGIHFKTGQNDTEQVVIRSKDAMLPMVRFDRNSAAPKLVVAIDGAIIAKENIVPLPIGGQWVKKIEPHYKSGAKRLDISVALTSGQHVAVMQKYSSNQKTFTLIFQSAYTDEAAPIKPTP